MKREYPESPLVGVGVAIKDGNRILLSRRANEPNIGKWSVPGGLVELGEGVRDAAKREMKEELGLNIEIGKLAGVYEYIVSNKKGVITHYVIIDFMGRKIGGELKPNSEMSEIVWATGNEAVKLDLTATTRKMLQEIGFIQENKL